MFSKFRRFKIDKDQIAELVSLIIEIFCDPIRGRMAKAAFVVIVSVVGDLFTAEDPERYARPRTKK